MFKIGFIYPGYENLGIEYLSANLKQNGFETRLFFDPILFSESGFINHKFFGSCFSYKKSILNSIKDYQPDLLCFSVITDNYKWACNLAEAVKKYISVPIIFGGIHPTSVAERVIQKPFVDYICIGEGDMAIIELAKALMDNRDTNSIKNIWAKKDSLIFRNEVRSPISDLDTLPFPDKDIYYLQAPIFKDGYLISTSRGCPFKCAYCCNNVYHLLYKDTGKIIRQRSVDNVLNELREAKIKYRPKFIHFVDDVFNFHQDWLFDFLDMYKRNINLPFSCYIYPDMIDSLMVKHLKEAGCFKIQMGLQVIDENKRRSVLKRNSTQENIARAIDYFKEAGIFVTCDNIFGFPDEKEEELFSLAYFYNEHMPNHCESFWLRYYPRTEITRWSLDNDYIDERINENIENGNYNLGLVRRPKYTTSKSYTSKFIFLLNIFPFLSKKLRLFILKHKIYRFFPKVSGIPFLIIFKIFNHPKYDFNTIRTIRRYSYFCIKKFKF